MDISEISAILRLSNKYDCALIRRDVCRRLRTELPRRLENWDLVQEDGVLAVIASDENFCFMSITIAQENNLKIILPAAYLCHLMVHSIVSWQPFYLFMYCFTCHVGWNSRRKSRRPGCC